MKAILNGTHEIPLEVNGYYDFDSGDYLTGEFGKIIIYNDGLHRFTIDNKLVLEVAFKPE